MTTCTKCGEPWADEAHVCNALALAEAREEIRRLREANKWLEAMRTEIVPALTQIGRASCRERVSSPV